MLVLSRKVGEQVLIPQLNITVTVLSAGPGRVQLGIKAPKEIDITRPEYQIREASGSATSISTADNPKRFTKSWRQPVVC